MSTSLKARANLSPASLRSARLGGICLALGGIAFFAGGVTHPGGGEGNKVEQLYQAFVDPMWYPSHALGVASFALFAAAILLLRTRGDHLGPGMARLVHVVGVVAVVVTLGMTVHLFSALGAESIADGQPSLIYEVQKWNETIISPFWGLGVVALGVAGGLTRTLGNRITIPLAVIGGLAWCLATATIAFTDRFDPLFPVAGSLISVWAIAVGLMWAVRTT